MSKVLSNEKKAAIAAMKDMGSFTWRALGEAFNAKFNTKLSINQLQNEYKKLKK